jgi:glycosyltransferase involved in cell wall biosynthesis
LKGDPKGCAVFKIEIEIIFSVFLTFLRGQHQPRDVLKITIITVCYDSVRTLGETIDSVLGQRYPELEYIIVDGHSTDGTQEVVRSYGSRISQFVSERDNGLYEAMNKGIAMATGDVIGILNSDDLFEDEHVLDAVMAEFQEKNVDAVFGDLYYFRTEAPDKPTRFFLGKSYTPAHPEWGVLPPHPTFFVRRSVYQKFGNFDTQFRFAADFDFMLRVLCVHKISFSYLPRIFTKMRMGGLSTSGWRRTIEINREDLRSYRKNGIRTNWFLFHIKYLIKIRYIRQLSALFN